MVSPGSTRSSTYAATTAGTLTISSICRHLSDIHKPWGMRSVNASATLREAGTRMVKVQNRAKRNPLMRARVGVRTQPGNGRFSACKGRIQGSPLVFDVRRAAGSGPLTGSGIVFRSERSYGLSRVWISRSPQVNRPNSLKEGFLVNRRSFRSWLQSQSYYHREVAVDRGQMSDPRTLTMLGRFSWGCSRCRVVHVV